MCPFRVETYKQKVDSDLPKYGLQTNERIKSYQYFLPCEKDRCIAYNTKTYKCKRLS
jgi:hypothetical protein